MNWGMLFVFAAGLALGWWGRRSFPRHWVRHRLRRRYPGVRVRHPVPLFEGQYGPHDDRRGV